MNISKAGVAEIMENDSNISGLWNTWGFDRILGKGGQFNEAISDRTTRDARTGAGITSEGKVVLLSVEGNDLFNAGMTFPEMWDVLHEFGAVIAGNNDGGSSSACWNIAIDPGKSLIIPSDGVEARVINHVLLFEASAPPIPGVNMPTVKATALQATNIKSLSGVPSGALYTLPIGGWVYGDRSLTGSDIVNLKKIDGTVNGFYRPTGEFVSSQYELKISATNLKVETITTPPPDPDPDPTPEENTLKVTASIVNGMPTIVIVGANGVADVTVDGIPYKKP
jgi:hypothetical protein